MAAWKLAAPLPAGCPVSLKPSQLTPQSTLKAAKLMAGVAHKGLVNLLRGSCRVIGDQIDLRPEVISITGSNATGAEAMKTASRQIRHVHLELGGKAPAIVFEYADIDAVAKTVRYGFFFSAGQNCVQRCRLLVADAVYDKVVAAVVDQIREIKVGAQKAKGSEMGPIISAGQRNTVAGFVARARNACEVVTDGKLNNGPGFLYVPTVLANVAHETEVFCNKISGPIVTISRFSDEEEALKVADTGSFGLASSVWTDNTGQAMRMTSKMRYGFSW